MAAACFWAELLRVKQECGDPEPPETVELSFENGILPVTDFFPLLFLEGFELGQDFTLDVEGDRLYLLRYVDWQDRYFVWEGDQQSSYNGPSGVPAEVAQGTYRWAAMVYSFWT